MIVQHNISALNSHRNLGINNSFTSKNLEKLSSGYRINRAGDDAAGLAISEKMRGQIRGLGMAEQNAENGISLIQTAEGGLQEVHSILQRMRELAVQSSNGTYQDDVDRENLDLEFQALKSEIDRIADYTNYNGIKLLDGSMGTNKLEVAGSTDTDGKTAFNDAAADLGLTATTFGIVITASDGGGDATAVASISSLAYDKSAGTISATFIGADGLSYTATAKEDVIGSGTTADPYVYAGTWTLKFDDPGTTNSTSIVLTAATKNQGGSDTSVQSSFATESFSMKNLVVDSGTTIDATSINNATLITSGGALTFQIGANGTADQRISLNVVDMHANAIGYYDLDQNNMIPVFTDASVKQAQNSATSATSDTSESNVGALDIKDRDIANLAVDVLDSAINMVSTQRAGLGALQNRLEYTLNNLGVTKENLTSAESTIRDVDMAEEMMDFTKNQILVQASQAMLAQANQLPQGVLNLLR